MTRRVLDRHVEVSDGQLHLYEQGRLVVVVALDWSLVSDWLSFREAA